MKLLATLLRRCPLTLLVVLTACQSDPPPPQDLDLIDNLLWQEVAQEADPLAEHRPEEVSCPGAAWDEEDASLEVDTSLCNYLALEQPARLSVSEGDLLKLVMWHAQLWDFEVAEAHVAVLLDEQLAWEVLIPIPSDPGIYDLEIESPTDLEEGAPIHLHLHNHGSNSWNFLELSTIP